MVPTARPHFGRHSKCCSVGCKHLKIIQATDAAFRMTPMLLVAMPRAAYFMPQLHFYDTTKIDINLIHLYSLWC